MFDIFIVVIVLMAYTCVETYQIVRFKYVQCAINYTSIKLLFKMTCLFVHVWIPL